MKYQQYDTKRKIRPQKWRFIFGIWLVYTWNFFPRELNLKSYDFSTLGNGWRNISVSIHMKAIKQRALIARVVWFRFTKFVWDHKIKR